MIKTVCGPGSFQEKPTAIKGNLSDFSVANLRKFNLASINSSIFLGKYLSAPRAGII